MSKLKQPKAPKSPKMAVTMDAPKKIKAQRKLEKQTAKRKKSLNKKIDRAIAIVSVTLAIVSGGLDIILKKKNSDK